jgi:hypothetical protein
MASFAVAIGFFRSYLWPRRCSLTQNRVREIRSVWSVAARTLGFVGPLLLLTVSASNAQGPDPNAGIQMWSTSEFGIDLATSGLNLDIPARSKAGAIPYFSHFFGTNQAYQTTAGGSADIEINTGLGYYDFFDSTSVALSGAETTLGATCSGGTGTYNVWSNFGVADLTGAIHPLPAFSWRVSTTPGCGTIPSPAVTTDGSGYTLVPGPSASYVIYDRSGKKWTAGNGDGTSLGSLLGIVTDPDNNSISGGGRERVLLGFAGASGSRQGNVVKYLLIPQQPTTLGEIEGPPTHRIREIAAMLKESGFNVAPSQNMDAWLKTHAVFVIAICGALYCAGADNYALSRSSETMVLFVNGVREGLRSLRTLGLPPPPINLRAIFDWMPRDIAIAYWRRLFGSERGKYYFTEHARVAWAEMKMLCDEVRTLPGIGPSAAPSFDLLCGAIDAYAVRMSASTLNLGCAH